MIILPNICLKAYFNLDNKRKIVISFAILVILLANSNNGISASAHSNNNNLILLPKSKQTDLGTEPQNRNNWITVNHDVF